MTIRCLPELLDEQVADTGFTHQWVLETFEKHIPEFTGIANGKIVTSVTAYDISGGQGYCSKVYKTSIFLDHQVDPSFNVVMKIPTANRLAGIYEDLLGAEEAKEMAIMKDSEDKFIEFHNTECEFYETFRNTTKLPLPKVYFVQKHVKEKGQIGVIVMEDMSEKLAVLGIYPSLKEFQIKTIVNHIAEFHAELIKTHPCIVASNSNLTYRKKQTLKDDSWKNKFPLYTDQSFVDMLGQTTQNLIKMYPGLFDNLIDKMNPNLDVKFIAYQLKGCGLPSVLSFGDLWTNNIFWEKRDDNVPNKILAFVDFQIAFEGSIATDISRVITMGCDAEDRRAIEPWICQYYYDQLTKYLGKKPDFTVEKFKTAYDYAMLHHTTWLMMFSVIFASVPGLDEKAKAILDAKLQKLALRTKLAMEDSIKIMERLNPEGIYGA